VRSSRVFVFEQKELPAQRSWRGKPSRWFEHLDEPEQRRISYWSSEPADVTIRILDDADRILREMATTATTGINVFDWDLQLNEGRALDAEQARLAAAAEAEDDSSEGGGLAATPWAEAVRLEWRLYITEGEYQVEVEAGEERSRTALTVKAPPERDPRDSTPAVRPKRTGP